MGNCSIDTTEKNGVIVLQKGKAKYGNNIKNTRTNIIETSASEERNNSKPQSWLARKTTCECNAQDKLLIQVQTCTHIIMGLARTNNEVHVILLFRR